MKPGDADSIKTRETGDEWVGGLNVGLEELT